VRLDDWPRMPFLSEELCGWVREHLATLGIEEIAVYAVEEGGDDDGRRVLVATEIGLIDYRYGPRASTARFAIDGRVFPWQAVRGVDLRVETFRLWALEHRTRWALSILKPRFSAGTEDPQLGRALADFAKVAVIMAEPSGWPPPGEEPKPASPPDTVQTEAPPPMARPMELAPTEPAATRSASRPRS
jgi:hypothetical protein